MADETIYVIDRVVTKPGCARQFVDAYVADYVPGGRTRGMTLDRVLVSPPIWIDDACNTVTITWTVRGTEAWWEMTRRGRRDPGLGIWWKKIDDLIVERSRTMAAEAGAIKGLNDV